MKTRDHEAAQPPQRRDVDAAYPEIKFIAGGDPGRICRLVETYLFAASQSRSISVRSERGVEPARDRYGEFLGAVLSMEDLQGTLIVTWADCSRLRLFAQVISTAWFVMSQTLMQKGICPLAIAAPDMLVFHRFKGQRLQDALAVESGVAAENFYPPAILANLLGQGMPPSSGANSPPRAYLN